MLISFFTGNLDTFRIDKINFINNSPYNGIAVSLIDNYDIKKGNLSNFEAQIKIIKENSRKDIWPWIFINRIIGHHEGGRAHNPKLSNLPYFRAIKGMDLYNETGALDDFFSIWRLSLRIAKMLGAPGIVVDSEAYNNYRINTLDILARETQKPIPVVQERLREIGRILADLTREIYPEAVVWFLFTGLGEPDYHKLGSGQSVYRSLTYLVLGFLERTGEKPGAIKVISGGEISLGYCHPSAEAMGRKIAARQAAFREILQRYPNLHLAGTLAPWHDAALKKPGHYFSQGDCDNSLKNLDDFQPLLRLLFSSYRLNWLYAAWGAGYHPWDDKTAPLYRRAIQEAQKNTPSRAASAVSGRAVGGEK